MSLEDSDPPIFPTRPLPKLTTSNNGNLVDIGRDDLPAPERKRMGDYLALITRKNQFPIKAGSELITLKTDSGNPVAISDVSTNVEKTFIDTISETGNMARSLFEKTSDTGLLDTDTAFKIKKGKSDEIYKTGTEYFREIDNKLGDAEIPKRVEAALLSNNRFNESNPALLPDEKETSKRNNLGGLIIQPVLGKHLPKKFSNDGTAEAAEIINIEKLKNFGMITMLQASGEVVIPTDLSNPESIKSSLISGVPGLARIGQRIPSTRFDGVKIINEAYPTFQKGIRDLTPVGGNAVPSYGSPNNPLAPFAAFGSGASQTSAILMSLTVSSLLRALAVIVNARQTHNLYVANTVDTIFNESEVFGDVDSLEIRRSHLGSSEARDTSESYIVSKGKLNIDLTNTSNEYFDCLDEGIKEFFGFSGNNGFTRLIQQTATSARNSGYQNTILREIVRSTTDVFLQQLNPIDLKLNTKMDIDKDPSAGNIGLQIAGNAIDFMNQINNSKLLKFMNILATIGDNVIKAKRVENNNTAYSNMNVDDIVDVNTGDEIFGGLANPAVLQMKSKLSDTFGSTLAWNTTTTPSAYLIPQTLIDGATAFDTDPSRYDSIQLLDGDKQILDTSNRLEATFVEKIETQLEASYMPFYFHDLRTNEIISFHAFLESLNDSFSVDYNETDSYGRIGKIRTYKNTNRSITLSFAVVATNEEGFDEMWLKINKLVTLLYPQWTEGRVLEFGTQRFVQPFSQLPKSSPLIRLRVGDIIKSNYSKFELARLFGMGSGNEKFSVNTAAAAAAISRDVLQNRMRFQADERSRMNSGNYTNGDHADLMPNPASTNGGGGNRGRTVNVPNLYTRISTTPPVVGRGHRAPQPNVADIAQVSDRTEVVILGSVEQSINAVRQEQQDGRRFKIRFLHPSTLNHTDGQFSVPASSLKPNGIWITQKAQERYPAIEQTEPSTADAIEEFFNKEQNPIVKSFESTKGKGLAGFITSFSFDMDQNTIWNTELGSRAPKMLKISIGFEPSHDLNPGIDNNGFMMAPLYNIGKIMNSVARDKSAADLTNEINKVNQIQTIPFRVRNR